MRPHWFATIAAILVLTTGCVGTGQSSSPTAPAPAPAGSEGGASNAPTKPDEKSEAVQIVDFGFGQNETYVQAIIIVTTSAEASVGEFVTTSVNFLDPNGQIVATETQVESFSWVGQELALPVWLDLSDKPGMDIASIEPSASITNYGRRNAGQPELAVLNSTAITKGQFGGYNAAFGFTNESSTDLEHLRIGIACYDASRKIIGGTSTFPDLAPAGKTIRIDAGLTVPEAPASCRAFVNYGVG